MLSLFSTLGGILLGGLPKLLDYFQAKQDQKHELALARAQSERELALAAQGFAAQAKVEEIRSDQIAMQTEAAMTQGVQAYPTAFRGFRNFEDSHPLSMSTGDGERGGCSILKTRVQAYPTARGCPGSDPGSGTEA